MGAKPPWERSATAATVVTGAALPYFRARKSVEGCKRERAAPPGAKASGIVSPKGRDSEAGSMRQHQSPPGRTRAVGTTTGPACRLCRSRRGAVENGKNRMASVVSPIGIFRNWTAWPTDCKTLTGQSELQGAVIQAARAIHAESDPPLYIPIGCIPILPSCGGVRLGVSKSYRLPGLAVPHSGQEIPH